MKCSKDWPLCSWNIIFLRFQGNHPKRLARWLVVAPSKVRFFGILFEGCSPSWGSTSIGELQDSVDTWLGLNGWYWGGGFEAWKQHVLPCWWAKFLLYPWGRKLKVSYKESLIDQKWYMIWFIKSKCISTYWDGKSNLRQSFWLINNESPQLNSTWSKGQGAGDQTIRPIQHSWLERCEIPRGWVSCSKCPGCRRWSVLSVPVMMIVNCCWSRMPQWLGEDVFFKTFFSTAVAEEWFWMLQINSQKRATCSRWNL